MLEVRLFVFLIVIHAFFLVAKMFLINNLFINENCLCMVLKKLSFIMLRAPPSPVAFGPVSEADLLTH